LIAGRHRRRPLGRREKCTKRILIVQYGTEAATSA
jgi:hypothetical protein